mgnify:CR=1 FL=1
MRLMKMIGSSIAALYLVCACLVVYAVGDTKPAVAVEPVKVEQVVQAKAEPVSEQSIVDEAAEKIPNWLELLGTLIGVASAIAAVTPTPKDNVVLGVLRKVLDIFALNVGRAKNASAVKDKPKVLW